ncbi:MAG: hypothetical protein ACK5LT_11235 [Lachnospirales bacterium]
MKKKLVILTAVIAVFVTTVGVIQINSNQISQISESKSTYGIDINDTSARIGFSDYVFVGEIIEKVGTEYRHYAKEQNGNDITGTGSPYTEYKVKIIENIKGDLPLNDELTFFQAGGLTEDKQNIEIYEGDELMEENNAYIIKISVQPDETLLASGSNNNTQININAKSGLSSNKEYQEYLVNMDSAEEFERERFEIVYE